jgi:mannose-6-phosphate isomerase-like protein (cupin superfamily)
MSPHQTPDATTAHAAPPHVACGAGVELAVLDVRVRVLLSSADTGGSVALAEGIVAPHAGPPLHAHDGADVFFRVIEGRFRFRIGAATIEAGPGHVLFAARGTAQCFYNPCERPGKLVMGLTPGGAEALFAALAAEGADPAPERAAALAAAHGVRLLGPNPLKRQAAS